MVLNENEWKHNIPKPLGHSKCAPKKEVYSNTGLSQEEKKSQKNIPLYLKEVEKQKHKTPNQNKEGYIRAIISDMETKKNQ